MQNVSIQKAEFLSAEVKTALESLLGRPLEEGEEVSIIAFHPHEAPQRAVRHELGERLNHVMDAMAQRAHEASGEELDEVLDDAMRAARPGYRPKK